MQISRAGAAIPIEESGISWAKDREKKYASLPAENFNSDPAVRGGANITQNLDEDEHFAVWMRPAMTGNFRKLWGRIQEDIPAGATLNVTIENRCSLPNANLDPQGHC